MRGTGAADAEICSMQATQTRRQTQVASPESLTLVYAARATRGAAGQAQSVSKNSSSKTAQQPGVALLSLESSERPWLLCCSPQQPTATVVLLQPHDAASCSCAL